MYISAIERDRNGERTVSIDEMTGIQAIERKEKDLPMRPGKVQLREFEYIRHGTQSLIANFDVASGKVIEPTCGDSRTEEDFVLNIRRMIETDPDATKWHLIMDCLNTHQSEYAGFVWLLKKKVWISIWVLKEKAVYSNR